MTQYSEHWTEEWPKGEYCIQHKQYWYNCYNQQIRLDIYRKPEIFEWLTPINDNVNKMKAFYHLFPWRAVVTSIYSYLKIDLETAEMIFALNFIEYLS